MRQPPFIGWYNEGVELAQAALYEGDKNIWASFLMSVDVTEILAGKSPQVGSEVRAGPGSSPDLTNSSDFELESHWTPAGTLLKKI